MLVRETVYNRKENPATITFSRFPWNRKISINDCKDLYYDMNANYLNPRVCWYLDMGLFETLEIILGEDLNPTIVRVG